MKMHSFESFFAQIDTSISIDSQTLQKIHENRTFLEYHLSQQTPIYGITTGFGPLVTESVTDQQHVQLQYNLIQQLSCNYGSPLPSQFSKAIFLQRIVALSHAKSGISPELFTFMVELYNQDILPVFRPYGSVGASGDLVPLTALARMIAGLDECYVENQAEPQKTATVFEKKGLKPYSFKAKEALAIVNGTSFSCGIACIILKKIEQLIKSEVFPLLAIHFLIFNDSIQHLSPQIYEVKAHASAIAVAQQLRFWLETEHPETSHGVPQPPYSSRSVVLWLGAVMERLNHAKSLLSTELNAIDDNPLFFHDEKLILHAANFQGTYTAIAADEILAAVTQLAILLERITNRLTHKSLSQGLPAFLADEPVGLNSGLQGLQLLITSLTADLRTRTQHYSLGSIPTNADNQDIVSMSANAALAGIEHAERFETLLRAFKIMVLRGSSLRKVQPDSKNLAQWLELESKKIEHIQFDSPNLNYRELMQTML